MAWRRGHSPQNMRTFINRNSPRIGSQFKKELSDRIRFVSKVIQQKISSEAAGGVVSFTSRSVFFKFQKVNNFETVNQIIVLPNQTSYLKYILDPSYNTTTEKKIIPISRNANMTKEGNIKQLRAKSRSNKYKKVKSKNGTTYLIDTTKKSSKRNPKLAREKRVIGYYGSVGRKPLFDFYDETEKKVIEQLRTLRGTFDYRWRK